MSNENARRSVKGLVVDLTLIDRLEDVRIELTELDNRCTFYASVYGREHAEYKKVHNERDQLLLRANKLLEEWLKEREQLPAPRA